MTQRHLRQYNPFVQFKSDVHKTIDRHIEMTNTILKFTMGGFGALGCGILILYKKTETDKKDLNDKIDHNTKELNDKIDHNTKELNDKIDKIDNNAKALNAKMDLILIEISTSKRSWF